MSSPRPDSLRRRLLIQLSVPLLGLMLVGAVLSYAAAQYFAALVHDQWLYDSAMSLATQVTPGERTLSLPAAAVQILEWDSDDRIYYEVASPSRGHIFGNATLDLPPTAAKPRLPGVPRYFDSQVNGRPVRVATVIAPGSDNATVTVAETLKKRDAVARSIMLAMLPLEGGILLLAGLLIWFTVTSALRSLDTLSQGVRRLDADRLQPLADEFGLPSEVKPLVDALNQLIGKLANVTEAQRRFVANAAHQLRTPLATMQVQTERALREAEPARQAEALADIQKAMVRLKHLTQQLLTLARAEPEGARMLEMVDVDLAALTRDALEPWTDKAIARAIDLGYDGPPSGLRVCGEPQLLSELIANLVDNAICYGRHGGTVTVRLTKDPITIAVEDDGPGIPPAERAHVMERFYRLTTSGGSGSGLGLAIAGEIASRHGAALAITTPPDGQGTLVTVTFGVPAATVHQPLSGQERIAAE